MRTRGRKKVRNKNFSLAVFLRSENHLLRFIEALKWLGENPYLYLKEYGSKHYAIESAFPWEVFEGNWQTINEKWKRFDLNLYLGRGRSKESIGVSKWNWKKKWRRYRRKVWEITEEQPLEILPDYHKRGFKNYHLDHRKSIWQGWKDSDPPEDIADISNLRMIPYKQNMIKGRKCE